MIIRSHTNQKLKGDIFYLKTTKEWHPFSQSFSFHFNKSLLEWDQKQKCKFRIISRQRSWGYVYCITLFVFPFALLILYSSENSNSMKLSVIPLYFMALCTSFLYFDLNDFWGFLLSDNGLCYFRRCLTCTVCNSSGSSAWI